MARTPEALVKAELLVWARESAGYSVEDAAARLSVKQERFRAWEVGEANPTVAQLRRLARLYRRPLAVFYLPEPPRDFQPLRDYRRLPDAELGKLSPGLIALIRRAHALREAALELREIAGDEVTPAPSLPGGLTADPEAFGDEARTLLGISVAEQAQWQDPRRALNAWLDAITAQDVLVLQAQSISIREMRGFSIWAERIPVVVLNGADFPRARIFTALHEFAHVLLNAEGVCDALPRRRVRGPTDATEIFCNRAAAAMLMPLASFLSEDVVQAPPGDGRWPEDTVAALAKKYSVSHEAIVRRLYSLDLASWDFLREKEREYRLAYEVFREEQRRLRREEGRTGGPSYYRMKVRDLGRGFIETALDAYYRRAITGSELSEYLEIKLNGLPKLEAELALTGGARD
jgi:Zn-dependent peptidase ImmA (M78 family)/transcriptional regulator with XRE-family HTH domain